MTDHSRLAIVGAFGATYISLAIADIDELTVTNFALLNSADFERPTDAIERYLSSVPTWPNKASFAFTGQVIDDVAQVERPRWSITRNDIRAATRADSVVMVRDLDALARMLPHLAPYDVVPVEQGTAPKYGTRVVVNAGAVLGVAALVRGADTWVPVSGYAADTLPIDATIGGTQGDVLSGRGLVSLYGKIAKEMQLPAGLVGARAIAEKGAAGQDPAAAEAIRVMAGYLANYAGDMALTFGAAGGIFLAGGLAANILPPVAKTVFGPELSARIGKRLGDVPVNIIKTGADAVIRGAALAMGETVGSTQRRARLAS